MYGPRTFVEYDLWKGFCPRVEIEIMNAFVQLLMQAPPDTGNREWVWSYFTGLKKNYRLGNYVKGTAMVMFNMYNPHHKSPYVDRVNMRVGFEFSLKKKSD